MSDIDYRLQAGRGDRAAELLENDILKDALDAIERDCVETWENCPARDAEGKEMAWQLYKTSKKLRAVLLGYVETGKIAKEAMKAYERKQGRVRRLLDSL